MDNVAKAESVVREYLESRKDSLNMDSRELITYLSARTKLEYNATINHENDTVKFNIVQPDDKLTQQLLIDAEHCLASKVALELIVDDETLSTDYRLEVSRSMPREKLNNLRAYKTYCRDLNIAIAVAMAKDCGIPAYSNGNNTKITACFLVKRLLEDFSIFLTVESVIKVWTKFNDSQPRN